MERLPKPQQATQSNGMTRRSFLAWMGNGVVAAGMAKVAYDNREEFGFSQDEVTEQELEPASAELPPTVNGSEKFEKMSSGYAVWWTMRRTTIAFFDKDNAPVGDPVPFQDFIDIKTVERDGNDVEMSYLYTPVSKDETGQYTVGSVAPEWSDYVEEKFARERGMSPDDLSRVTVAEDFVRALSQDDEPELQEGIRSGAISTNLDIVHYFGDKRVRGAEQFSRIEYVRNNLEFHHPRMSETVKNELRELLPALCAKESKFNDDLTSKSGARGISQFMPDTWNGLGLGEYGKRQPLSVQVMAMSKHCDNIYGEFLSDEIEEMLETHIVPLFPNREAYERDFLVPCMVNAYNPGAGTLRTAVREFLKVKDTSDFLEQYQTQVGKDVFFAMNRFALDSDIGLLAEYKERSAEYVNYIYALRDVFAKEVTGDSLRVASN